jgi:hypothetical protein
MQSRGGNKAKNERSRPLPLDFEAKGSENLSNTKSLSRTYTPEYSKGKYNSKKGIGRVGRYRAPRNFRYYFQLFEEF